jgi:hypothetical protein
MVVSRSSLFRMVQGVDLGVGDRGAVLVVGLVGALVDESVVGVSAAVQGDVGHGARRVVTQHSEGGVGGDALGSVHSGRVAQGHVCCEVVAVEDDAGAIPEAFGPSRFRSASTATTCQRLPLRT